MSAPTMLPSSSRCRHAGRNSQFFDRVDAPARTNERTCMAARNVTERVEVLEMRVGAMEELPARMAAVEAQIVQLRTEMRSEFSAVRQEMGQLGTTLRQEMRTLNDETRAEMRMLHEEVLDRISRLGEGASTKRK